MATTSVLEQTDKVEETTNEVERSDTLNALHRCDHKDCSAAAFVRAVLVSGNSLLFCGHHYQKIESNIEPFLDKDNFVDERWKLTWDRHKGTANS